MLSRAKSAQAMVEVHTCATCSATFPERALLDEHTIAAHPAADRVEEPTNADAEIVEQNGAVVESSSSRSKVCCPLCTCSYQAARYVDAHMKAKHKEEYATFVFRCTSEGCSFEFQTFRELYAHQRRHDRQETPDATSTPVPASKSRTPIRRRRSLLGLRTRKSKRPSKEKGAAAAGTDPDPAAPPADPKPVDAEMTAADAEPAVAKPIADDAEPAVAEAAVVEAVGEVAAEVVDDEGLAVDEPPPKTPPENPFPCQFCGKRFRLKPLVKQHEKRCKKRPTETSEANEPGPSSSTTKAASKESTGDGNEDKPFPCTGCNKRFKLQHHLRMHADARHPELSNPDGTAKGDSPAQKAAAASTSDAEQEKPFECPECARRFRHLHTLRQHSKIHKSLWTVSPRGIHGACMIFPVFFWNAKCTGIAMCATFINMLQYIYIYQYMHKFYGKVADETAGTGRRLDS